MTRQAIHDGLKDGHRNAIIQVLSAHPRIQRAILFGSRAMGTYSSASDIDIALVGDALDATDLARLAGQMEELNVPQKVDLLLHRSIQSPQLLEHIRRIGFVLYDRLADGADARPISVARGEALNASHEAQAAWPTTLLSAICTKIGSGATPTGGSHSYLAAREQFALIRSQNVFDRCFSTLGLAFITDEQASCLRSAYVINNDILFNITGDGVTFGRACLVPVDVLPACVNQHVSIIRVNPALASPGFVLSYLTHPATKTYIESFNAGGSRRAVTKAHIESFRIPLPPLPEQRRIAAVLGALDDKIELNRRMNQTLEAMAQALFKSWFIDFDGHTDLVDSELGPIPRGWRVGRIDQWAAELETGNRPSGGVSEFTEGVPSIGAESIDGVGQFDFTKTKYVPGEYFRNIKRGILKSRDILLYKDGGKPGDFRPHVGMFGDGFPFEEAALNSHVYRLRLAPPLSQEYGYFWFASEAVMEEMHRLGTGVAIPSLPRRNLLAMSILVPPVEMLRRFDDFAVPAVSKILANARQSRTLAALRDTLLPKLISGEVRVPDIEGLVEEAV